MTLAPQVLWGVFAVVIGAMLVLDLGVLHRRAHEVRVREALFWSAVWIALALAFMVFVTVTRGHAAGLEFLTCYLIEESLSVDNLFVFLLIFSYFKVPRRLHHKALFWGVVGAIVMRAVFIAAGVAVIRRFEWLVYVLGALLVIMGIRMAVSKDKEVHPERNPVLRLFRKVMPVSHEYVGDRFFFRQGRKLLASPLFVVLLVIETTDVVFAIDSVPAALAISRDTFVVYTANIFAIVGLRSLYFALAGIMPMFGYLHYGLSVILVFTGLKMILAHWVRIPIGIVLGVIGVVLTVSIVASIVKSRREKRTAGIAAQGPHG